MRIYGTSGQSGPECGGLQYRYPGGAGLYSVAGHGDVKIIDLIKARLDAKTDSYVATFVTPDKKTVLPKIP